MDSQTRKSMFETGFFANFAVTSLLQYIKPSETPEGRKNLLSSPDLLLITRSLLVDDPTPLACLQIFELFKDKLGLCEREKESEFGPSSVKKSMQGKCALLSLLHAKLARVIGNNSQLAQTYRNQKQKLEAAVLASVDELLEEFIHEDNSEYFSTLLQQLCSTFYSELLLQYWSGVSTLCPSMKLNYALSQILEQYKGTPIPSQPESTLVDPCDKKAKDKTSQVSTRVVVPSKNIFVEQPTDAELKIKNADSSKTPAELDQSQVSRADVLFQACMNIQKAKNEAKAMQPKLQKKNSKAESNQSVIQLKASLSTQQAGGARRTVFSNFRVQKLVSGITNGQAKTRTYSSSVLSELPKSEENEYIQDLRHFDSLFTNLPAEDEMLQENILPSCCSPRGESTQSGSAWRQTHFVKDLTPGKLSCGKENKSPLNKAPRLLIETPIGLFKDNTNLPRASVGKDYISPLKISSRRKVSGETNSRFLAWEQEDILAMATPIKEL